MVDLGLVKAFSNRLVEGSKNRKAAEGKLVENIQVTNASTSSKIITEKGKAKGDFNKMQLLKCQPFEDIAGRLWPLGPSNSPKVQMPFLGRLAVVTLLLSPSSQRLNMKMLRWLRQQ